MAFAGEAPWAMAALPGETADALRARRDLAYFDWQIADNAAFWDRLGQPEPSVAGAHVLELGCGHGALAVDAAKRGAAAVVATDLDCDRIAFARRHVALTYPDIAGSIDFRCQSIADVPGDAVFDIVLCKDTVEHILDPPAVFAEVHRLLKPGGQFVIGTSPLYYSPFGDHGRYLGAGIPWLGALMPEPLLFALARRKQGADIRSAADVGLNKMTPTQFRAWFAGPEWAIERIRYNAGDKPMLAPMRALRRFGPFERLFTVSIYAVIVRR